MRETKIIKLKALCEETFLDIVPSIKSEDHIVIPLLGHFKGKIGECYHLTPLAAMMKSRIRIKVWMQLLLKVHATHGRKSRPAFCDHKENQMTSKMMQKIMPDLLMKVQTTHSSVILADVDVLEEYDISCLFHRRETTQTCNWNFSQSDIKAANQNQPIMDHYPKVRELLLTPLHISKALQQLNSSNQI